jgi:3-deoxy-D-manno-octulosonic-acid transferase
MRFLYLAVAYLLAPVVCGTMLLRGIRDRSQWENFSQRFGFGPRSSRPAIWVHAVSVGEVQAAASLVLALRRRYPDVPLVVTTVTPTGAQRARALFGDAVQVRYIPYDLPGSVRRFFNRVRPRVAVILETELWPNLYHFCGQRKVPLVLASARISPRSVGRYRLLASLFRETLSHGIVIAAQGEGDAERFRSIGANPARTHVTGNIKFDLALPDDIRAQGAALRERYAPGERLVWVAGSTHDGEEAAMILVQRRLRAAGLDVLLVLVPRHPGRFQDVAALLRQAGVPFVRRSTDEPVRADTEVLLVDTLGELVAFYAAADLAFVGGSLVPVGGHNLLEPAALALATLSGPQVFNAQDIAGLLVDEGAVELVADADALGEAVLRLLSDPAERRRRGEAGLRVVERNRGALERLLDLLRPVIDADH